MSSSDSRPFPDLRRIVTTHDDKGVSIIQSDTSVPWEVRALTCAMQRAVFMDMVRKL